MSFAKVYTSILDSSLAEDWQVRHVFEDMLKLCDADGALDMTPEAIARRTNVPIDVVSRAITELEKPDPQSRTATAGGIRIVRMDDHRDWGWYIVNYSVFRAKASEEQKKANQRERFKRWHEKNKKKSNVDLTLSNVDLTSPSASASASESVSEGKESEENQNSYEQRFPIEPTIEAVGKDLVFHLHARTALWFLNEKAKRVYRETSYNLEPISMRLNEEGVEIEAVKAMIDRQVKLWQHTRMKEFLRPSTLFGKEFDTYYAARNEPISSADNANSAPRNRGTFNESEASKYNLSTIQKNRQLQADTKPGG